MTVVLEAPGVRAEVDPSRGARLVSLQLAGLEVLGVADDASVGPSIGEGCYPMVPWAGRIRDGLLERDGMTYELPLGPDGNALHGTGRDALWSHDGDGTFRVALGYPWPSDGEAVLTYEPRDHGLRITLEWHTDDDFGSSLGLHPWFRRDLGVGEPLALTADPVSMVERGTDGLPTGRLVEPAVQPWDDCFALAASPVLRWEGALEVTLTTDAPWWVVFTEPTSVLCVEPQSVPPDAFAHPALQPPGEWPRRLVLDIAATAL
jgi:aldose 1-epimerase